MGKAPKAPNPTTVANAQTASNVETAIANAQLANTNQIDAQGNSLTYTSTPGVNGIPQYTATQKLGQAGQQLLNTSQATQQNLANLARDQSSRIGGLLNRDLNFSGLPQSGSVAQGPNLQTSLGSNDFSLDRQRVEEGMFSRLNPQIDRQRQQLEQDLVNRGIRPGSSAYSAQQNDFNQGLNDQRTSILLNAGQEQNRMQQLALNAGNFTNSALQNQFNNASNTFGQQNTLRQNAMSEMLTQRQVPINEVLALAGAGQLQQPQFTNTPQVAMQGTDVAGIAANGYNQQMQQYGQNQSTLGGLFSAGASLIPLFSDARLKTNIIKVGDHPVGVGIYEYDRIDTGIRERGVIAQELEKVRPDLVDHNDPSGYARVHYSRL